MEKIAISFMGFILCICAIAMVVLIIQGIIMANPVWYNKFYNKAETKRWEGFIKLAKDFTPVERYSLTYKSMFELRDAFNNVRYIAMIWNNGLCSIHSPDNDCVCCTFNKKLSKKMADRLMEKVNN